MLEQFRRVRVRAPPYVALSVMAPFDNGQIADSHDQGRMLRRPAVAGRQAAELGQAAITTGTGGSFRSISPISSKCDPGGGDRVVVEVLRPECSTLRPHVGPINHGLADNVEELRN